MTALPTVQIRSGDSFCIINESDFDPAIHELWRYVQAGQVEIPNTGTATSLPVDPPGMETITVSPETGLPGELAPEPPDGIIIPPRRGRGRPRKI